MGGEVQGTNEMVQILRERGVDEAILQEAAELVFRREDTKKEGK